eukprot:513230_1
MGNYPIQSVKKPLDEKEEESAKQEFAKLRDDCGYAKDQLYLLMKKQTIYIGRKDSVIANYDDFIQRMLGGENTANVSMPAGIYNHYVKYFTEEINDSFKQLSPPDIMIYKDNIEIHKKAHDGVYEWLLVAYVNCRAGCVPEQEGGHKFFVRYMFQVAIYTKVDEEAKLRLLAFKENEEQEDIPDTPIGNDVANPPQINVNDPFKGKNKKGYVEVNCTDDQ